MYYNTEIIDSARSKDICEYLESLSYPRDKKHSGSSYIFFRSPLRATEKTASFAVRLRDNTWMDYGSGEHGNIITLCMRLEGLTFPKAIERLTSIPLHKSTEMREYKEEDNVSSVEVLEVKELQSKALIDYLKSRRISEIAFPFVKEVKVNNKGKIWSGIGFRNNKGSWELRNKYVKIALAPKDITTIPYPNNDYCVFEGFVNFLSYLSFYNKLPTTNIIVLNSVSLVGRVKWNEISGNIYTYFDQDKAGDLCTSKIERAIDKRDVYKGYNDFNRFLIDNFIF